MKILKNTFWLILNEFHFICFMLSAGILVSVVTTTTETYFNPSFLIVLNDKYKQWKDNHSFKTNVLKGSRFLSKLGHPILFLYTKVNTTKCGFTIRRSLRVVSEYVYRPSKGVCIISFMDDSTVSISFFPWHSMTLKSALYNVLGCRLVLTNMASIPN